jgi:hypothetical protein
VTDHLLPQLETALDAAAMREVFRNIYGEEAEVCGCEVSHIRYKPGQKCIVGYSLRLRSAATGAVIGQYITGRVYPPCASGAHFTKAIARPLTSVEIGKPINHIPELSMILWAFPNERKLSGLRRLSDRKVLQQDILPGVFPQEAILEIQTKPVHYVPENGYIVRLDVRLPET